MLAHRIQMVGRPIIRNGLVGWWPINEGSGTTLKDHSGNGNNASAFDSPAWGTMPDGSACIILNGTSQYLVVAAAPILQITSNFTWVLTTYLSSLTIANRPAIAGTGTTAASGYEYTTMGFNITGTTPPNGTGKMVIMAYDQGPEDNGSYTSKDFSSYLETQYSLAGSWDGSMWNTYVNGVLDRNNLRTQTAAPKCLNLPFYIGAVAVDSAAGRYLHGKINNFRVYNRALSATELTAIASGQG